MRDFAPVSRVGELQFILAFNPALARDIPTMIEAGVAGYEFTVWNMMLAPTATPKPVLDRLHASIVKKREPTSRPRSIATPGS